MDSEYQSFMAELDGRAPPSSGSGTAAGSQPNTQTVVASSMFGNTTTGSTGTAPVKPTVVVSNMLLESLSTPAPLPPQAVPAQGAYNYGYNYGYYQQPPPPSTAYGAYPYQANPYTVPAPAQQAPPPQPPT